MPPWFAATGSIVALLAVAVLTLRALRVVAQPDEWLLCIRNGRLIHAGVGISLWPRPGDVIVRFTSTVQRVAFVVNALSSERLPVTLEGFILWSVSPKGDDPFKAFQKLGLVNLDAKPAELRSTKHLLATSQHRAFRQLLGAAVQRLAATRSLEDLLLHQDRLVADLGERLRALQDDMGIVVGQIEIVQVRASDEGLMQQMSVEIEQRLQENAARVRLEAAERAARRTIDSEARLAEERARLRRREMERETARRIAQLEHEREVQVREEAVAREQALAAEARALELAHAVASREKVESDAHLDRIRREAEAERDAISAIASAEAGKPQPVRDHELARLVTEKVGDAVKGLPLREAKWVSVGRDSPAASIAELIGTTHELVAGGLGRPARRAQEG